MSQAAAVSNPAPVVTAAGQRAWSCVPPTLVAAIGLLAWWGVWHGQYLFDDLPAIEDNVALGGGHWWRAAFSVDHQPLANRPLTCLTLAWDFAVYGPGPFGPHLTSLLLHLGNAMLVLATVRAALSAPNLAGRFEARRATRIATAVALIWVAHPLGGDAVAYATQRSTLLFSGFLLVGLLASLRAASSPRPIRWRALAVLAIACGMASKEDMVAAPLLLVLWERAFVLPSWAAMRRRAGFFAVLAGTWLVLVGCLVLGPANPTVGYATTPSVTAWHWLLTQAGVLVHYVRLVLWPHPLRGAYDWDIVTGVGAAALPLLAVLVLLGLTIGSWRARPWWGFCGALFFLLLAPTSSLMPIVTEILAERRMYLPMLTVLVPAVLCGENLLRRRGSGLPWLAPVLVLAVTLTLAWQSRQRVAVYADSVAFWDDAFAQRDPASRSFLASQILGKQAEMLLQQGRVEEAIPCIETALQCEHHTYFEEATYALSLQRRGRHQEAVAVLRQLVAERPDDGAIVGRLGNGLVASWNADKGRPDDARLEEAVTVLQRAVVLSPRHAGLWHSLGFVLRVRGDLRAAADAYQHSVESTTARVEPYISLAELLPGFGRQAEVGALFDRLLAAHPGDTDLRLQVAGFLLVQHRQDLAVPLLQDVLRIDPTSQQADQLLREAQTDTGR